MGVTTAISWTDATVNFWTGCKKVSDGCKFCYMYRDKERYGQDPKTVLRSSDATFYAPLRKKAFQSPQRVFTCSWSDFFIEEADAWRADAWKVIKATPHLTYQILTKRPERVLACLPDDWGKGYANIWLGVTVEHQDAANERIPILSDWFYQMDNILFVSFEPLLGPIDLFQVPGLAHKTYSEWGKDVDLEPLFHWAIIGGESGNDDGKYRYRPCELDWIEQLIWQLEAGKVDTFVKQLGTHLSKQLALSSRHGTDISEWPSNLRIQEFPDPANF